MSSTGLVMCTAVRRISGSALRSISTPGKFRLVCRRSEVMIVGKPAWMTTFLQEKYVRKYLRSDSFRSKRICWVRKRSCVFAELRRRDHSATPALLQLDGLLYARSRRFGDSCPGIVSRSANRACSYSRESRNLRSRCGAERYSDRRAMDEPAGEKVAKRTRPAATRENSSKTLPMGS
jgi:hypothetical protein